MTTAVLSKKIQRIELELETLKRTFKPEVDFDIDEKNWDKIKNSVKQSRKRVYQKSYGKA